jgi:type I restriction enzyme S subunit
MSELKKYKLGDLGFFFGGVTSIKKEDYGHGTPFLPYKNVYKNSKVNVNELELMNVRQLDLDRRSGVYGDIFFTASSETPDEVAMSSVLLDEVQNLTFNGFCKRFRLHDFNTLLPEYARYLFRDISFRREVYQLATGDIRFNISQESLANIEIEIPNIETQKEIAQILTSLDDKIEINQQMNQTLEAMAQSIFKEWFVNFNFPGFDGELVDGLPKGWRNGSVLEIATLLSGGTPKTSEPDYWDGEINWISAKDITSSNNQFIIETEKTITELGIRKSAAKLLPIYTTIISARGTVGNFCILPKEMAISQSNYGLKSNSDFDFFLFLLVKNMILMMKAFAYGAVFDTITTKTFEAMEITIPENQVIEEFENFIKPIYSKILTNQLQIQSLTHSRDTLLPKLMSGQLEVMNT